MVPAWRTSCIRQFVSHFFVSHAKVSHKKSTYKLQLNSALIKKETLCWPPVHHTSIKQSVSIRRRKWRRDARKLAPLHAVLAVACGYGVMSKQVEG